MEVLPGLDQQGYARLPGLVSREGCRELIALFEEGERFRKTIEMGHHAYGEGRYRYFADPLPGPVQSLRGHLYRELLPAARELRARLEDPEPLPATLDDMRARCAAAGQHRPTPLLLRYGPGGYNRMHQDVYGAVAFPLQVVVLLSPNDAFEGGEFLVSESRPRMQTRTEAVALEQGEGLVFANAILPVQAKRGWTRAQMRHGLSRVRAGERYALGLIFHNAE